MSLFSLSFSLAILSRSHIISLCHIVALSLSLIHTFSSLNCYLIWLIHYLSLSLTLSWFKVIMLMKISLFFFSSFLFVISFVNLASQFYFSFFLFPFFLRISLIFQYMYVFNFPLIFAPFPQIISHSSCLSFLSIIPFPLSLSSCRLVHSIPICHLLYILLYFFTGANFRAIFSPKESKKSPKQTKRRAKD